ncbi:MAG: P-loop NTPase, partial [Gammaproteobacteria bacterium]
MYLDQASGLRYMNNPKPVKVITVSGGKGGVGKSNLTVNLAMSLAKRGQKVLIMDADLGLANIDIMLGLRVEKNLSHLVKGECTLDEIIIEGPS